jgi:hypothetical protein
MIKGDAQMREFVDGEGRRWIAGVRAGDGLDFKGRYYFVARPAEGGADDEVELQDVRWNGEPIARRTLQSMSDVELRRRLRSARGRADRSNR